MNYRAYQEIQIVLESAVAEITESVEYAYTTVSVAASQKEIET